MGSGKGRARRAQSFLRLDDKTSARLGEELGERDRKLKNVGGRTTGADPSRVAGDEVPAIEIEVLLVVIDAGGAAAAAIVLLSRPIRVAGRPFSGSAGVGRGARRCATA